MATMRDPGICPYCKKVGRLEYGTREDAENGMRYPFRCPDCGGEGAEVYILEFSNYEDEEGEMID
jgi:hypothetical protein